MWVNPFLSRGSFTGFAMAHCVKSLRAGRQGPIPRVIMSIPHQELQLEQPCSMEHVDEICAPATLPLIKFHLMADLGLGLSESDLVYESLRLPMH